jgi:hypothetical protein
VAQADSAAPVTRGTDRWTVERYGRANKRRSGSAEREFGDGKCFAGVDGRGGFGQGYWHGQQIAPSTRFKSMCSRTTSITDDMHRYYRARVTGPIRE